MGGGEKEETVMADNVCPAVTGISANTLQCKAKRVEGSGEAVGHWSPALASMQWYSEGISCQATSSLFQVW